MSGADNVVFNNLERAKSGDQNDLQDLKDRFVLEMLRELLEDRGLTATGFGASSPRDVVLGGLEVSPAGGADISVNPGVLVQDSTTLSPVPGTFDSSYRYARNPSAQTIGTPAPGSDTWYLLEAQMDDVLALNEPRDIFNPATQTFTPAAVNKRFEREITFQLTAGGAQLPAVSVDFVPIAGVFRPSGGGTVLASHIVDLRPLREHQSQQTLATVRSRRIETQAPGTVPSELVKFQFEADFLQRQLAVRSEAGHVDVTDVLLADPGITLTALAWYNIYLAGWTDENILPAGRYGSLTVVPHRGVFCLSDIATGQGGLANAGTLNLPAPFNTVAKASGQAIAVGALLRNGGNNGWEWLYSSGDGEFYFERQPVATLSPPTVAGDTITLVAGAVGGAEVPTIARTAIIRVNWTANGAGDTDEELVVRSTGGTQYDLAKGDWNQAGSVVFRVPIIHSLSFDLEFDGANPPATATVDIIGYGT
jgi:hypothetical protein